MGNASTIVATRANLKVESQGKNKKLIVTDTAAGVLQMKQHSLIKEHTDQVNCVAMSPTGILASSGNDGEIVLYDTKTQKPLAMREDASNLVYALCFSPTDEGRHLITASFDKTIRLFNIAAFTHPDEHVGDTQKSKRLCQLLGHKKAIGCIAYSRDAHFLATGSDDETVILWNAQTTMKTKERDIVHQFLHPGPVYSVAFAADSKSVFTACKDQLIRHFSCETGLPLLSVPLRGSPSHAPLTLSASADGTLLASGSLDKTIIIWDLTLNPPRPKFSAPLLGHSGPVRSVAFSNNSSFLVSGSEDATIRVWKVLNGMENDSGTPSVGMAAGPILAGTERVNSVCWSPDNNFVVSASYDSTVRVFTFECPGVVVNTIDVTTPDPENAILYFEFSADGEKIIARDEKNKIVEQWFTTPRSEKRIEAKLIAKKKQEEQEKIIKQQQKKLEEEQQQQHKQEEHADDDEIDENWAQQVIDEGEQEYEQVDEQLDEEEEEERIRQEEEAKRNKRYFQAAGIRGEGFVGFEKDDDGDDEHHRDPDDESSPESSPTKSKAGGEKKRKPVAEMDDEFL